MIKKIPLFLLGFMVMSCSSKRVSRKSYHIRRTTSYKKPIVKKQTSDTENPTLADKIIWSAFKYRGVKYKYGGTTKKGMDCSGLVMVSFAERGISLPRSSYGMSKEGMPISLKNAQRGDLIFFKTNPRKPNRISHVGLITHIKNGVVQFLHASTKRGVILSKMDERYYKKRFAGVRRVLK